MTALTLCEIWKDVTGFEGLYQVSNLGRVKSLDRISGLTAPRKIQGRLLRGFDAVPKSKGEYIRVGLYKNDVGVELPVHRLVAMAFIPNPTNKPQVNHKDGNKLNNHVDNLEWVTEQENSDHAVATGLLRVKGEDNPSAKLTNEQVLDIFARRLTTESLESITSFFKIDRDGVYDIWRGERWTHITGANPGNKDWVGHRNKENHKGTKNGRATLTEFQVLKIRYRYKTGKNTRRELQEIFGTTKKIIDDIVTGKTWRHLL